MLLKRSCTIANPFQSKYICPQCRLVQTHTQNYSTGRQPTRSTSSRDSRFVRRRNLSRCQPNAFSQTSGENEPETASLDTSTTSEYVIPIRKEYNFPGTGGKPATQNSFIRNHLRTWSIQHQKEKKTNAPEDVPAGIRGVSVTLPNALFIEDSKNEAALDEEEEAMAEYDESLEGSNKLMLEPGDLTVQGSRIARKQIAIFLGMVGMQHHFLLADGRWLAETVTKNYSVQLHKFASDSEIARIKEYLPKKAVLREDDIGMARTVSALGDVPPHVSKPVLDRMAQLIDEMSVFRRDNLAKLDSIYDRFAHENEHFFIRMKEVAKQLFETDYETLSDAGKMSLLAVVQEDNLRIQIYEPPGQDNLHFIFTPKTLVKKLNQVVEWARAYQECAAEAALGKDVKSSIKDNPLSAFIDKARRLILKSRKIRSPTTIGSLGPSTTQIFSESSVKVEPTGETYTESDKMILEFLWNAYLRQPPPKFRTRYHSIGSLILRGIGAYPRLKLENKIGQLLLQELGSMAPWAQASDDSVIFPLPGRRGAHGAQKLHDESEALSEQLGFTRDMTDIPLQDTMADMRKDWGSMEVFCIDKPSSTVIDDGYSIESHPDVPGAHWIHCHVAHPSSMIEPDHIFAQRARVQGQSLYTSRQVYAMMPWDVVNTLSLRPGSAALTISTLLNEQGEVLDIQICPSRVNNIVSLERRAVSQLMGTEEPDQAYMVVGPDPHLEMRPGDQITEGATEKARKYLPTLEKIKSLLQARIKARQREVPEYANYYHTTRESSSRVSFLEAYDSNRLTLSQHYHGDPTIKIVADRFFWHGRHSDRYLREDVTTHVMLLTGESAGKWFRDRDIPACYNGTLTHPEFPLSKLNNTPEGSRSLGPAGKLESSPIPHVLLNLAQYLRLTSPLRRYVDLMAGWQADAYLRAVAEGKITSNASANEITLPFTKADVDNYLNEHSYVLKLGDHAVKKAHIHWSFQALFRAFHFKEAELPEVWDFQAIMVVADKSIPEETGIRGRLTPFDLTAVLLESKEKWEDQGVKWESYLPVKIEMVDVSHPVIYVRAVGPPSQTPTQKDPIRIQSRRITDGEASEKPNEVTQ